jgi:uncharacterized protein (DUF934 family)
MIHLKHTFPLNELDAIFIEFAGFNDGRGYSFAALLRRQGFKVSYVQQVMCLKMS